MRKNIEIDEFIIMPDHIHLILFITTVVRNDCIVPNNNIVPINNIGPMQLVPTVIK